MSRISARSRRQAMDWSLVLMSQGIESTIVPPADEGGWALLVSSENHSQALDAIAAYRAENRGWNWSRQRVAPGILFDWTSVIWICFLLFCHWFSTEQSHFKEAGIFDGVAVAAGEWWRVVTAIMLHADSKHLASNCAIGVVLLGLTMGFYGAGIGLSAAFIAGIGGNLIALGVYGESHRGLGASGMVLGSLGLLGAQWFVLSRKDLRARKIIFGGIAGAVCLFVLFGVSPGTDVVAHAGGFFSGIVLGVALAFLPESVRRNAKLNLFCGLCLGAFIVLCWFLALRAEQIRSSGAVN
jgi:rhomboid protease GluP